MLRIYFFLFSFFIGLSVYSQGNDTLLIRYNGWDMYSNLYAPYINFENYLGITDEFKITRPEQIDSVRNMINKLIPSDDRDFSVECKLYFINKNDILQEVCLSDKKVLSNGCFLQNDSNLISYINHLMAISIPTKIKTHYPSIIGNDFSAGADSLLYSLLTKKIDLYANRINFKGKLRYRIICTVDKQGNTTDVIIKLLRCPHPSRKEYKISKYLRHIMKEIKWKSNMNRTKKDKSIFLFVYSTQT